MEPLSVTCGIGLDAHDHEGRVITAEFDGFFLVCCYTPNAQNELAHAAKSFSCCAPRAALRCPMATPHTRV